MVIINIILVAVVIVIVVVVIVRLISARHSNKNDVVVGIQSQLALQQFGPNIDDVVLTGKKAAIRTTHTKNHSTIRLIENESLKSDSLSHSQDPQSSSIQPQSSSQQTQSSSIQPQSSSQQTQSSSIQPQSSSQQTQSSSIQSQSNTEQTQSSSQLLNDIRTDLW